MPPASFFLHAPRTGGSFTVSLLGKIFGDRLSIFEASDSIYWQSRQRVYSVENQVFAGHISYSDVYSIYFSDIYCSRRILVTLIRDPLQRVASNLCFWWRQMQDSSARIAYEKDGIVYRDSVLEFSLVNLERSLEGGLAYSWKYAELLNPYCHQYSWNLYARTKYNDGEAYEAAAFQLARFRFIGLSESLPQSASLLVRVLTAISPVGLDPWHVDNLISSFEAALPIKSSQGSAEDLLSSERFIDLANRCSIYDLALYRRVKDSGQYRLTG